MADDQPTDLAVENEVLREEVARLQAEYARAKASTYRRTAIGFLGLGVIAFLAGAVFADARTILFALGGTGVFAAVLVYYLTPEQFVPVSVTEGVYRAVDENGSRLVDDLGLRDDRVYVPREEDGDVKLFVPAHAAYTVPESADLDAAFVVTNDEDERGVSLDPTGLELLSAFEESLVGSLDDEPAEFGAQLADGAVETLELARSVTPSVDDASIRFKVTAPSYRSLDGFDNPVTSFLACGVATATGDPTAVSVTALDADAGVFVVTCRPP